MKVDEVLQNLDGVLTELYYQKKYYAQPKYPAHELVRSWVFLIGFLKN